MVPAILGFLMFAVPCFVALLIILMACSGYSDPDRDLPHLGENPFSTASQFGITDIREFEDGTAVRIGHAVILIEGKRI
jgi:hypothetical protein